MRSGKWAAIRTMALCCESSPWVFMLKASVQGLLVTAKSPQIDLLERKAENGGPLTHAFAHSPISSPLFLTWGYRFERWIDDSA